MTPPAAGLLDRPDAGSADAADPVEGWLRGYRTGARSSAFDELLDAGGAPRGAWPALLGRLARLGERAVTGRFLSAERHIRDAGISYRVYGDQREHPWSLGPLPLVLDAADWAELSAGIVQRAELMERIVADLYGPGELVARRLLPAAVAAGSPEFLRPLHGIAPPGGRFLRIYAADVGRAPDGRWRVLADRTQAPSGLGFALENRMVLARAFPDLLSDLHVERRSGKARASTIRFSRAKPRPEGACVRSASTRQRPSGARPTSLARYLGFLLVEGDDLTVRDGQVHVRTVAGLKRADALLRRIDADYLDPMELRSDSRLGVPGLLDVLRRGGIVVGNMPGSGVLESAALAPYLPRIAAHLLGEPLRLPDPPTWWCGDPRGLAAVRERLGDARGGELTLRPAATPVRGTERDALLGASSLRADRARAVAALDDRPFDWVGQERGPLSTMPAWSQGRLVARPFVMRVFAAATPEGWRIFPGAFCRMAETEGADPSEMRAGIRSADVWVLSDAPVETPPLLGASPPRIRRIAGHLPSRAADNLFWLGRYLERAEGVIRLVEAHLGRQSGTLAADSASEPDAPTALRIRALLDEWGCVPEADLDTAELARAALAGREEPGSARAHVLSARRAASSLRERLPTEAWRALTDLGDLLDFGEAWAPTEAQLFGRAERALGHLSALAGLAHENMNHAAGWNFLDMGRRVERAVNTCTFALAFAGDAAGHEDLGVMLALCDAQVAYGARYLAGVSLEAVRDMVLLDPYNPRSVAFQVEAIARHLDALPALRADGVPEPHRRAALRLSGEFATAQAADLDAPALSRFEGALEALAGLIGQRYFPGNADALRAEKLTGLA